MVRETEATIDTVAVAREVIAVAKGRVEYTLREPSEVLPRLLCLGTTRGGEPLHPLYLRRDERDEQVRPHEKPEALMRSRVRRSGYAIWRYVSAGFSYKIGLSYAARTSRVNLAAWYAGLLIVKQRGVWQFCHRAIKRIHIGSIRESQRR